MTSKPKAIVFKKKRLELQRSEPLHDYLKYYRVVRYWAKRKHELSDQDLEILFFIASERLFSRSQFEEYCGIFSWNRDRFKNLKKNDWIRSWRNADGGKHAMYEASYKSRRLMDSIYKKLNGEQDFPTDPINNPTFKRETFTDKVMSNQMLKINKEMRNKRKLI